IDRTRETVLARMVNLFQEARETIRKTHQEIAVVIDQDGRNLALTVDAVDSVEALDQGSLADMSGNFGNLALNLVGRVGRRREGGAMVLLLEVGRLFDEVGEVA
ncbi:MAG: chemotaxis protein CheW, partial [Desulfarculus sp.]|nr:chemotaxis protein CheW [Desulfarculus sp.]